MGVWEGVWGTMGCKHSGRQERRVGGMSHKNSGCKGLTPSVLVPHASPHALPYSLIIVDLLLHSQTSFTSLVTKEKKYTIQPCTIRYG